MREFTVLTNNQQPKEIMWEALPLSKLGAWDGQCIWKMKNVNRRCSMTVGPGRVGNRDELLASIRRGETLTGQERIDLARSLCCLEWHSTEYIAQQICGMWARQPAPEVSLLELESGVEKLRKWYAEHSRELEKSKTTEEPFCDNCLATFPEITGLQTEIEGLKKTLNHSRNANERLEKELFTAKFGFVKMKMPRKITVRLPPIKRESIIPITPEERIACFRSDTPANTNIFGSPSFRYSRFSFSPSRQALPSQPKAYSASPTHHFVYDASERLPRTMPLDTSLPINFVIDDQAAPEIELKVEVKEEPTLQTTLLSAEPLPTIITTPSSSAQQLTISTISTLYEVADISSYSPQLPIQHTVTTGEHEHSGLLTHAVPVATDMEKLLVSFFRAFTFLCFFSSLTFTQFTSVVVWSGVVVCIQATNGEIAQAMRKYYSNQFEESEATLIEEQEVPEVVYPVPQPVVPDPADRKQEKERSEVLYPVPQSVVPGPEDRGQEKEASEAACPVLQSVVPGPEDCEHEKEASEVAYPVLQSVVSGPEDSEQEKGASEVAYPILLSVVLDPEDKEPELEVIETTNMEAPHHPTKVTQLSELPGIKTGHTEPAVAAIVDRKFTKAKKPTRAPMEGLELPETMFVFTSGKIPAVLAR